MLSLSPSRSRSGLKLDDGFPEEGKNWSTADLVEAGASSKDPSLKVKHVRQRLKTLDLSHSRRPSSDTRRKKKGPVDTSSRERRLAHPRTPTFKKTGPVDTSSLGLGLSHRDYPTYNLDWLIPKDKGYTTAGFIYNGGVYLAADHAHKSHVPNIVELGPCMLAAISGASDSLLNDMKNQLRMAGNQISVVDASKWMACFLSSHGEEGSSVEMLIGGVEEGGPALHLVDGMGRNVEAIENLWASGHRPSRVGFSTGSGYLRARAPLDIELKPNLPVPMVELVAKSAICFGVHKSLVAGSFVSVYHIDRGGWKYVISGDDVKQWRGWNEECAELLGLELKA